MNTEISCPKCNCIYSEQNPPKNLIQCSHVICLNCLKEEIHCPIDGKRINRIKHRLFSFSTNQTILQAAINSSKIQAIDQETQKQQIQQADFEANSIETHQHNVDLGMPDFDMCLLHNKKAQLVCLQCKEMICPSCGLFGQHQRHKIMPFQQFFRVFSSKVEEGLKIVDILKQKQQQTLNEQHLKNKIQNLLNTRKEQQTRNIRSSIIKLTNLVKAYEKQLLTDLNTMIQHQRNKLLNAISLSEIHTKKDEYINRVLRMSLGIQDIYKLNNIEEYIGYIQKQNAKSFILSQGEYLTLQIDNMQKHQEQMLNDQIGNIRFQFKELNRSFLQGIATLQHPDKFELQRIISDQKQKNLAANQSQRSIKYDPKRSIKTSNAQSGKKEFKQEQVDLLLDSPQKTRSNLQQKANFESPIDQMPAFSSITMQTPTHYKNNQPLFVKITEFPAQTNRLPVPPPRPPTSYRHNQSSNRDRGQENSKKQEDLYQSRSKRRSISKSRISYERPEANSQFVLYQRSQNKKQKKKLQIPPKFAKVFQDMQQDKTDTVDFGGAQLGDTQIMLLSQMFSSCNKLKTVKLMKNKISDEVFPLLMEYCRTVVSVNLSYNLLTEKSLEWLQINSDKLGKLKTITLSNNKIQLRTVKDRLQGLKRKGLNISL